MTLVMKFGGTSVGSAAAIRQTAELIRSCQADWGPVVVVASAMGTQPVKVTDLLLQGAYAALAGDEATCLRVADALRQAHYETIDGLLAPEKERQQILAENQQFIERFAALCRAVLVLGELTPRALDTISAMGEQMSVRILAAYLREAGLPAGAIDATELLVTDDNFQSAAPLWAETTAQTQARLQPLLDQGIIPIVTGFIGATQTGVTTTLGRGGSDFSAAILGQALAAQEVWIWTDVDGVMTADPRLVPAARSIPVLSFREVAELAYYGARVLHPKTMRPCVENDIPLRIKNTFNPQHPGTVIVREAPAGNGSGAMKAVTAIKELSLITVEGRGMMGVPGIAARTFGAVARGQVSVLLISQASSEQSICFAAPAGATDSVLAALEQEFTAELQRKDIDRIWALRPVAIVTVVGAGMRGTPGIAGRIFSALGREALNIIAIAQGSSECSVSLVVDGADTATAVQRIHELL
ncbi:MAG: aspartate kinase [Ardenticatenaceae bacterium]|nr:aspartate kinase [Ardenticatenaceae bacterium]